MIGTLVGFGSRIPDGRTHEPKLRRDASGVENRADDLIDFEGRPDSRPTGHLPSYLRKEPSNWAFAAAGASSIAFFCCAIASVFLPLSKRARA